MSEGVGDLLFFPTSVLPVGWGISKVLTFVDERGLRGVSCMHVLSQPQRRFQRSVYTTERKWHGSDKNWNGSDSFCKETVKFYPFRVGSTGAYGPVTGALSHFFSTARLMPHTSPGWGGGWGFQLIGA